MEGAFALFVIVTAVGSLLSDYLASVNKMMKEK